MNIAIANQKGGTGKTTITFHLSYMLAEKVNVLSIDLDPQAALTRLSGFDPATIDRSIYDVFVYAIKKEEFNIDEAIKETDFDGTKFRVIPSKPALDTINIEFSKILKREQILLKAIERVKSDVVLFDCQPTFSPLTINALVAADAVLIPIEPTYLSIFGAFSLLEMIGQIRKINPDLKILGFVPNKTPPKSKIAEELLQKIKKINTKIYPSIPFTVYFDKSVKEAKKLKSFNSKTAKKAVESLEEICLDIFVEVKKDEESRGHV